MLTRKLQTFIEQRLRSKTIIEKLQEKIWFHTDCALAVMSADGRLNTKVLNARPNMIFEIGYCLGFFDQIYAEDHANEIRPVVLVKEDRTYIPSDLNGLELIDYSRRSIQDKKSYAQLWMAVQERLESLFALTKNYYR